MSNTHGGTLPQENPFDKTLSGLPEMLIEEPITDRTHPDYNAFLDPESIFYGLPNFKATGQRPIPTARCYKVIDPETGRRCKNRSVRGTGLNGTNAMCHAHGGRLPTVKAHADRIVEAARLALMDSAPDAIQTIMNLMKGADTPHAVKLKAATEILDRNNIKGNTEIAVEVTHHEKPSDKLMKKLNAMRKTEEEEVIDAAEVLEDLGEAKEA